MELPKIRLPLMYKDFLDYLNVSPNTENIEHQFNYINAFHMIFSMFRLEMFRLEG